MEQYKALTETLNKKLYLIILGFFLIFLLIYINIMPNIYKFQNKVEKQNKIEKIEDSSKTKISEVFTFAKKNNVDKKNNVVTYDYFESFNFSKLEPINQCDSTADSFYKIGYDSNQKIILVERHEKKDQLFGNFDIKIFYNHKYFIMSMFYYWSYDDRKEEEGTYLPGFFVCLKNTKQIYFINTQPTLGVIGGFHPNYIGGFPIKDFESISTIMSLNANLYANRIIKISKGQIIFGTSITYKKDLSIDKENIYLFNVPEHGFGKEIKIDENSCFDDYDLLFKKIDPMFCYTPQKEVVSKSPVWLLEATDIFRRWTDCYD